MISPRLSEKQVRLLLFQFYDDQILNPSSDVILSARVLRVIENTSDEGVLAKVLEEGKEEKRLTILADHHAVEADVACIEMLDYVDLE